MTGKVALNQAFDYVEAVTESDISKPDGVNRDPDTARRIMRSYAPLRTSDTRYFTDPAIATAALGIGPGDLMNDLTAFGLVFETLVARDLRVYADALDGKVRHYLDKSGLECDFVIGLRDGRSGLVEVKLGGDTLIEEGATSLNALFAKLDTSKTRTPSFRMIVVADGDFAYRRKDGVIVCPIAALKL